MKPISQMTTRVAVKLVGRWGALATALATISFAPSALAQFQMREEQPRNAVRIEAPERNVKPGVEPPQDLQIIETDPGVREGGEGIDDPWTWFCLVNFPPEELADCIDGIP